MTNLFKEIGKGIMDGLADSFQELASLNPREGFSAETGLEDSRTNYRANKPSTKNAQTVRDSYPTRR